MSNIERKVYVCPEHGEVLDVVGMGRDKAPLHAFQGCGQEVEVVKLVPDSQLRGAVDPETLERHRWALDAAVRFITESGGNPDVVKSLLILAEWGQ